MEPRIQYAKTSDGVSIAFTTLGEGMPLVSTPGMPFGQIRSESLRLRLFDRLAANRTLVIYDARGSGLSDRDVTDFSLEAHLLDLVAVVDCLGLERFALLGKFDFGPVAIACAARQPEQVSHLILWSTWASASDVWSGSRYPAVDALRRAGDWELYTETVASQFGLPTREEAQAVAASLRESATEETVAAFWEAAKEFDVTSLLLDVKGPALVLHPTRVSWQSVDSSRRLASRIPNARLTIVDSGGVPLGEEVEALTRAVDEFLGDVQVTATEVEPPEAGAFRTILFTDLVDHTEMMSRLGDERGRAVLREHERITRDVLMAHGGTEVKTMGDGFMASFGSVTKAVECAVALQRAFAGREGEPLSVRVGLNAGEPIEEDGDLFGATVILASRIAAHAEAGEILIPEPVRHLLSGKPFVYADRGEFVPKGFDDAVRLYEVRWREED